MQVKPNDKWARGDAWNGDMADDVPQLKTYREALIHHNAVSPFSKGANKGKKPLGHNRRYSRLLIRMGHGGEGEEFNYSDEAFGLPVVVSQHNNDIVKYFPDGSLKLFALYESVSTAQIMQELLGLEKIGRRKGKIYYFDGIGHAFRITNGGLHVCADGHVDRDTAYNEWRHALNRDAFKALKEKYKAFTEYAKMVTTMTQGGKGLDKDLIRSKKTEIHHSVRNSRYILSCDSTVMHWMRDIKETAQVRINFFDDLDTALAIQDETKRFEAMLPLVEFLSFSASTNYSTTYQGDDLFYVWAMDNKRLIYFFNEVLKFHHGKELFKRELAPLGTISHDGNYKYVEFSTHALVNR